MASTETEIVNLALIQAGATKLLTDLATDKTPEAGVARSLYPQRRDELLCYRGVRWPFATKRVVLAQLLQVDGVTPVARTDWAYVYAAPADMLSALRVVQAGLRNPRPEDRIPFRLEAGEVATGDVSGEPDGQVILTDLDSAEFMYVSRCTKVLRMSPLFQSAVAARLAIDFATHLTKKGDLAKVNQQGFVAALSDARVHAASQGVDDQPSAPYFLEDFESVSNSSVRFGLK